MSDVSKCTAALRLFGELLDPDEVTRLLGRSPTSSYRKGDVRTFGRTAPKSRIESYGMWLLDYEGREPADLDVQIAEIFAGLTQELSIWTSLTADYEVDLSAGHFMQTGDNDLRLSLASLTLLAERGVKFGCSIYEPDLEAQLTHPCYCQSGKSYGQCHAAEMIRRVNSDPR